MSMSYADIVDQIAEYAASVAATVHAPAVAIGIMTADGLVEARHLGTNHAGAPVTSDTLFEIGSATKAFLGVTEAILVDRGVLAWSDRVIDHYPAFEMHDPWVTREFRIDDLLAQRTGLSQYAAELVYGFGYTWNDNIAGLKYLAAHESFRRVFAYQNMPHAVAGAIVADKIGADGWNDAVYELLLDPLGMTSSGTALDALRSSEDSTRGFSRLDEVPVGEFPSVAHGAGSIVSNLTDMAKWVGMHLAGGQTPQGRLISFEQLQRTYMPLVPIDDAHFVEFIGMGDGTDSWMGYATGWFTHAHPEGRVIEHGGNTDGYNAAVAFDPDRGVGLVVLTNQGFAGGGGSHIGKYGMDLLQGRAPIDYYARMTRFSTAVEKEAQAERERTAGAAHPLEWYEGVYANEFLGTLELRVQGNHLTTAVGPNQVDGRLERSAGRHFTLSWDRNGPGSKPEEAPVEFAGDDQRPERFTIKDFVFVRSGD